MLKNGGWELMQALTDLVNTCWVDAKVPEDLQKGVIAYLPNKGNLSDCNNWLGITLSVPGKVLCSILLRRLRQAVDEQLREEQGFRRGRSCMEQIFVL